MDEFKRQQKEKEISEMNSIASMLYIYKTGNERKDSRQRDEWWIQGIYKYINDNLYASFDTVVVCKSQEEIVMGTDNH